jgi:hypothetical protein
LTIARAMQTRCCWPPESCIGRWSHGPDSPTFSASSIARCAPVVRRHPEVEHRDFEVLEDRELLDQVEVLEDEPDPPAADFRQLVVLEPADVDARRGCSCRWSTGRGSR